MRPSANGENGNGRDSKTGKFTKGWKGGPGNPYSKRIADLRSAFIEAVTEDDLHAIVRMLLEKAKGGDVAAGRLILEYTLGRPAQAIIVGVGDGPAHKVLILDGGVDLDGAVEGEP